MNKIWTTATSTKFKGVTESFGRFFKLEISIHTKETPKRFRSLNADAFEHKNKKSGTYVMLDNLLN